MTEKNIIFGIHAIEAVLLKQPERIQQVYLQDKQQLPDIVKKLTQYGIKYDIVGRDSLDRMTERGSHQGIVAQCAKAKSYSEEDLQQILTSISVPPLLLILDGVQDPHNLGACLRTADAAGVHAVIAPKDKSVGITPTVSKVACGAAETVPFVQVTNLARTLKWLKAEGVWLYGMSDDAEKTVYQENFKTATGFIMGNEEKGMRHLTREHCDVLLKIPMQGSVSSLNVSVATGVCLYEVVRQRG